MFKKTVSTCLVSMFVMSAAFAKQEQAQRPDGSKINYFVDEPEKGAYPVLLILQDSECVSVKDYQEKVGARISSYLNAAVVTVDKRGLAPGATSCTEAYKSQNTLAARLEDYRAVLADLERTIEGWDHRIAFAGIGEGGTLAPILALENPGMTVAVGLLAAGGGISRTEELRILQRRKGEVCGILTSSKLDQQLDEILKNASSTKTWCQADQSHKWWASSLRHNPMQSLLALNVPIYVAHGTADLVRPIEGADAAVSMLKAQGHAVTYDRYEGYDHLFTVGGQSRLQSVMLKGLGWVREIFGR